MFEFIARHQINQFVSDTGGVPSASDTENLFRAEVHLSVRSTLGNGVIITLNRCDNVRLAIGELRIQPAIASATERDGRGPGKLVLGWRRLTTRQQRAAAWGCVVAGVCAMHCGPRRVRADSGRYYRTINIDLPSLIIAIGRSTKHNS